MCVMLTDGSVFLYSVSSRHLHVAADWHLDQHPGDAVEQITEIKEYS